MNAPKINELIADELLIRALGAFFEGDHEESEALKEVACQYYEPHSSNDWNDS